MSNSDTDGSRSPDKKSSLKRRAVGKLILFFLVIVALGLSTPEAEAGIFSFVDNVLSAASAGTVPAVPSAQTMALLEAVPVMAVPAPTIETQIIDDNSLFADSGPLGSAADFASATPLASDQISVYTVRRGDSLSTIADLFNVSINTILWANDLKKGAAIHEGDKLVILPISGVQYTVKKGDTLPAVAKKFGGDANEILAFNNLGSDKLTIGQTLIIPDGDAGHPAGSKAGTGKKSTLPSYSGYYVWPVDGGRKSQGLHGHNGIDIAAPSGTGILAAAEGTVIIAKDGGWNGGYGTYAVIKHSNGTQTLYAHMSGVSVAAGQTVSHGERIGAVGSTGLSTGNHLHFEVRGAKNPF